jgi:Zn finger protein HypA/HybF involved in hydrogenase expression
MKHKCEHCNHKSYRKDMELRLGGLLCPKCRYIMFAPYDKDNIYFKELRRRNKEANEKKR